MLRGPHLQWNLVAELRWSLYVSLGGLFLKNSDVVRKKKKKDGAALEAIFFMQPGLTLTGLYSQSYGFSSSHVWMWELDHKEGWVPKKWFLQTMVLDKTLGSPLDSQEIKPVNPKENRPWIFIGRSETKAEAPILQPSNAKSWLIGKDPDARKDWRQKEKRVAENEMVREHHRLHGYELEQTGDTGRQGSLVHCGSWSQRESDTT